MVLLFENSDVNASFILYTCKTYTMHWMWKNHILFFNKRQLGSSAYETGGFGTVTKVKNHWYKSLFYFYKLRDFCVCKLKNFTSNIKNNCPYISKFKEWFG